MKTLVFPLEVRTEEQGTWKEEVEKHLNNSTFEQFNSRRKKEEAGSGDWQRPVQPCCRNEIPLLQLSLIRNSIRVKTFVFTLEVKTSEQGTLKEEIEKHLNN